MTGYTHTQQLRTKEGKKERKNERKNERTKERKKIRYIITLTLCILLEHLCMQQVCVLTKRNTILKATNHQFSNESCNHIFTWIPLALAKDCLTALNTSPTTYDEPRKWTQVTIKHILIQILLFWPLEVKKAKLCCGVGMHIRLVNMPVVF